MPDLKLPKDLFFVHDKDRALTFEASIIGTRAGDDGILWMITLNKGGDPIPFDPQLGRSPGGVFVKGYVPGGLCLPFDTEHPHALARENCVDGTGGCYRLPGRETVPGKSEG